MKSIRNTRMMSYGIQYVLMIFGAVIFMFPLVWMVSRSLMGLADLYTLPPRIFPSESTLQAYREIWDIKPFGLFFKNTVIIVVWTVLGGTISSALCAFGFARLRFPLRNLIFGIVLTTMMLPGAVTMIPVYVLFSKLGWVNSLLPLIVPSFFGGGAFNIFLLRQFFATIPKDFDEAARMDGASTWAIFWRICLPLCVPAITVVAVFAFKGAWDDFMGPLIYLNSEEKFTLALGLFSLSPARVGVASFANTAHVMAACSLAILPVITVFIVAQKRLISGTVVSAGIKG
ncbi:carbohydrate ABC transporter permease [Paenibacillus eucommiae]|uniref:Multiple sugar transport system permease protein n=1 Tax=Paenibacillus eucommiae TaxID=1355755 RepID=A0ABS4IXL3_9BACL|nr:carbohydrate ABC transporter permease [Paenibacillus eucommiae]MBP1991741.1 multiple sugar transport system permease protein [Paenibacillus eucommiae]